jgi:hypothetical protein
MLSPPISAQQWGFLERVLMSTRKFSQLPLGGVRGKDGLSTVSWERDELTVEIADRRSGPVRRTVAEVDTVQAALDILVALDVLPVPHSSAYRVGLIDGKRAS